MYMMANEFIAKGFEEVPEDVRCIIAANIVQLTFGREDYRLSKFERIVVYPGPFPSPQIPKYRHASELHEEDGVLLFSAEQLMGHTFRAGQSFNIALYEYAKAFRISYPKAPYPKLEVASWAQLEAISGLKKAFIEAYVGLPEVDLEAVAMTLFLSYPNKFKAILPEVYLALCQVLNLDPDNLEFPIVDQTVLSLHPV